MRTRWLVLLCFVVVPLVTPSIIYLPAHLPANTFADLVFGVAFVAAIVSVVIAYVARRVFWLSVLCGFVTAVITAPVAFLWVIAVILVVCSTHERCLD